MKRIRLTLHAAEQCIERGCSEGEVRQAVVSGVREPAKRDRLLCRCNFEYNALWQGKHYAVKQVAPVIVEETDETVVITVYVFYF